MARPGLSRSRVCPRHTTQSITLESFDPAELLVDVNARSKAEDTVDKAFIATLKAHAATSPDGCGNYVPVTIVIRPDGQLRVRAGARRTIGCQRAGVRVLGFVAGHEGDEQADRRARLIEQWNENHNREPMTVTDETTALLTLFRDEDMSEAAIAKATGLSRSQVTASLTVARSKVAAVGRRPMGLPDPGPGRDPGRVRQ